ncbi:MAG: ABC transporter ATP-binding protein [Bacteroidota bacterium]
MILVELKDVTKEYDSGDSRVRAIRNVSLTIESGEFVSIMGPSGSGKSTLISVIGGLSKPTKGKVYVDGMDVYALSSDQLADLRREYIGFVFQSFQLVQYLTVLENVMLPMVSTGKNSRLQYLQACRLLDEVGLAGKADRLPDELSGGEQQRVAIARALVNEPLIILADEPTGNLDSQMSQEILSLFRELNERGRTIVMVTHNPENRSYSSRCVFLRDGMIVKNESVQTSVDGQLSSVGK